MKNIAVILICVFLSSQTFACKTCGCSAKKNTHTHTENSIKKEVNVKKSFVKWLGSKVTGSHEGYITIKEAHLHFENNDLSGGNIVIDMTTINCTDLKGESKASIEGHLSSDDFFGVNKFKTASLEIIKAEKIKNSANKYNLSAILKIKNIEKEIEFSAVLENRYANANVVIDRTQFDIKYNSGSFFKNLGDKMINDDFNLSVSLSY